MKYHIYPNLKTIIIIKFDAIKNSKNKSEFIVYQNTWSNQRAKRRRKNIDNTQSEIDKSKTLLKFYLKLSTATTNKSESVFKIESNLIDSLDSIRDNHEYLNQIIQYIKNNLCDNKNVLLN
jgi:hypothetical protein